MSHRFLRPWAPADAAALQRAYLSTPDLITQMGDVDLSTIEASQDFVKSMLGSNESTRNWAIIEDGIAVGNVGASAIELRHGTAWMYYWLTGSARGRGLATQALSTAAEWAFDAGLFRLELGHRINNPSSCRVATRAGFIPEGIERGELAYGDDRFDVELHARLATDPAPAFASLPIALNVDVA